MENSKDIKKCFYEILGVQKSCAPSEIRAAYKKLAMVWHPDKCGGASNAIACEHAKSRFQAIQEAYTVLSDDDQRFLYDAGFHETEGDQEYGMSDFLSEIASMMKDGSKECEADTFEELKELFLKIVDDQPREQGTETEKSTLFSEEEDFYNKFLAESCSPLSTGPSSRDTSFAGACSARAFESSMSQDKCSRKRKFKENYASTFPVESDHDGGKRKSGACTN